MLNIGLVGANGRMGRSITGQIKAYNDVYNLKCAIVNDMQNIANDVKDIAQVCTDDINLLSAVSVVIDFSTPKSSLVVLPFCVDNNLPLVIGTTGFSQEERLFIEDCAKKIPIVFAPNTSLSVNILYKIVEMVANKLTDFDVEITEAHHKNKKDAPSGTALKIGETIAKARNIGFNENAKFTRHGNEELRQKNEIGFSVIRGGDIVGMHDVQFIGDGEILSFKSQITNRASFANGALKSASFVVNQSSGLYDMYDVLGIK